MIRQTLRHSTATQLCNVYEMPYIGEVDFYLQVRRKQRGNGGLLFPRIQQIQKSGQKRKQKIISSGPLRFLKLLTPLNLKHPSNGLWDATETASRYKEPLKNFSCSNDRSRLGLALKSVWRCTLVVLCNFTAILFHDIFLA